MSQKHLVIAGLFGLFSVAGQAETLSITLTNLTQGIYFTPVMVVAHDADNAVFHSTEMASAELAALAEFGNTDAFDDSLVGADIVRGDGFVNPGTSLNIDISSTEGNDYLSIATMMLPTNDGFVGLDSWKIPTEAGTYTVLLNAYDAGTEANNELMDIGSGATGILGIPGAPGDDVGSGGTGLTEEITNGYVHIHPGVLGDADPEGGFSDLDSSIHRWLNPVAKLTVVVE